MSLDQEVHATINEIDKAGARVSGEERARPGCMAKIVAEGRTKAVQEPAQGAEAEVSQGIGWDRGCGRDTGRKNVELRYG
jgi:hypothetical protein